MPNAIPGKGIILSQMSLFWFDFLKDTVLNHLVSAKTQDYPEYLQSFASELDGRSMLVKRTNAIAIECVARGYLAGSGWKEYKENNSVCGIKLPNGLKMSAKLPEPIFTPATKAESGHDENISEEKMANLIGAELTIKLRDLTLKIYQKAAAYAYSKGIIIADTKFEFGLLDNKIILIDEVLTPDSSRFWPAESYKEGQNQPSFDKQYLRDYLETLDWNKQPPAPELPLDIITATSKKYKEAYNLLTGLKLTE
jgi:phosphoribosylaminoimidazole-succinocarboxamide synthase